MAWVLTAAFIFLTCIPHIHAGLVLLLELLESTNSKYQRDSSMALCRLANKASSLSPIDAAPPSPIPQVTCHFVILVLYQWIDTMNDNVKNKFLTKQGMLS